jgi:hypothetical protein
VDGAARLEETCGGIGHEGGASILRTEEKEIRSAANIWGPQDHSRKRPHKLVNLSRGLALSSAIRQNLIGQRDCI